MQESIHGHEVMHMMLEYKQGFTRESLIQTIEEKFGANAIFHTCSAEGLSSSGIVDFLATKGKFHATETGNFNTDASKICNH